MLSFTNVVQTAHTQPLSTPLLKYLAIEEEILRLFLHTTTSSSSDSIHYNKDYMDLHRLSSVISDWKVNKNKELEYQTLFAQHAAFLAALTADDLNQLYHLESAHKVSRHHSFEVLKKIKEHVQSTQKLNTLIAAIVNSFSLAISLSVQFPGEALVMFEMLEPLVHNAWPIAIMLMAGNGIFTAMQAFNNKNTRLRYLVILEGLSKAVLASFAGLIGLGVLAANPLVAPILLTGMMVISCIKDHMQLQHVNKEIDDLSRQYKEDQQRLKLRLNTLEAQLTEKERGAQKEIELNDPTVLRLALQLDETSKKIATLKVEAQKIQTTRNVKIIGLVATSLLVATVFFPPASIAVMALITTAITLFFVMNKLIQIADKHAQEKMATLTKDPVDLPRQISLAKKAENNPGLSATIESTAPVNYKVVLKRPPHDSGFLARARHPNAPKTKEGDKENEVETYGMVF